MAEVTPISELPSFGDIGEDELFARGEPRMTWDMRMPDGLDTERIVVNVSRLKLLHAVAHVATSCVTDYQGEKSEYSHTISGVNSDGSASVARSAMAHRAPRGKGAIQADPEIPGLFQGGFGRVVAKHAINRAELTSHVVSDMEKGRARETAWARQLDKALTDSFRDVARQNLFGLDYMDKLMTFPGCAAAALTASVDPNALPIVYGAHLVLSEVLARSLAGRSILREWRPSIIPGYMQPEHYVAVNGLTRLPGLIRSRK